MRLRLYNTLSRQKEEFEPLDPDGRRVTFYTCGPTVYDYAHIGNFRSFLNADLLRRTLELLGYEVRHVMNMTDVGHMTDDEVADGSGEDKMALAARRLREAKKSGKLPEDARDVDPADPYAVAEFYIHAFLEDARTLGLKVAREYEQDRSLMPRPTEYIQKMIDLIQTLIDAGHAYVASDGVVYYDVGSFPDYGRLSGNTPESIRAGEGGRVDDAHQAVKKHPADFMLWKPDPRHLMRWPSPWGEGYPGWHLECSVMAATLLGEEIDIHSGGEDNIFPHHECEIAQTRGATGRQRFARFWFHTRHLMVEGEKMSKSRGNFYTPRDLLARGASPAAIRLALTATHYRDNANFTTQLLRDAQGQLDRWMRLRNWLMAHRKVSVTGPGALRQAVEPFTAALSNDLNVSGAVGAMNEAVNTYDVSEAPVPQGGAFETLTDELEALDVMLGALGVLDIEQSAVVEDTELAAEVEAKIAERNEARAAKDFATADRIRDELHDMGVAIKDSPQGTTWERVVR